MAEADNRNILDKYKWWEHTNIVENMDTTRSPFITVCMNIDGDFNLSSLLRSTSWFNGTAVWIVGKKKWDRRGAVGTHHYTPVKHYPTIEEAVQELKTMGYTVLAAEITPTATPLNEYVFPDKTAVIYGEEGLGLTEETLALVDEVVLVPARGAVRSLNVANTGSIFLWEYHRQKGLL